MDMTIEQKALLLLMADSLRQQPTDGAALKDLNWKAVAREAYAQAVPLLFFDSIAHLQAEIPEESWNRGFTLARRGTARNIRTAFTQQELAEIMEKGGFPYVILKGEAASAYYPVPELRQLGDVDFITPPAYMEKTAALLQERGFAYSANLSDHHHCLFRDRERLEMHIEIAGMPKGEKAEHIQSFLETLYTDRQYIAREENGFYAPSHAHHGLILLLHMQHHMVDGGIGLRHLMDWACFVQKTAAEGFWQTQLLPLLEKIGLKYYAAVVTKMCAIYLQIDCPVWADDAEDELCRELMEDLFAAGNFGRKDQERMRAGNMLPEYGQADSKKGKLNKLADTLRQSSLRMRPELKNKPVRLFFFMVYRAFRYIVLFCGGKRANLLKAATYADERRAVYGKLRMYETE